MKERRNVFADKLTQMYSIKIAQFADFHLRFPNLQDKLTQMYSVNILSR